MHNFSKSFQSSPWKVGKDRKKKRKNSQHPVGFEPTTSRLWCVYSTAALQPQPTVHNIPSTHSTKNVNILFYFLPFHSLQPFISNFQIIPPLTTCQFFAEFLFSLCTFKNVIRVKKTGRKFHLGESQNNSSSSKKPFLLFDKEVIFWKCTWLELLETS